MRDHLEAHPTVSFDILVDIVTKTTVPVPNHMILCSSIYSFINVIDSEQVHRERRHTVATVQAVLKRRD